MFRSRRAPSSPALDTAIDALASYRMTRLIVSDGVVERQRETLLAALDRRGHHKAVELFECPWCIGFWIAGATVALRRFAPAGWDPVARTLAFSAIAGLLASEVRSMDDSHDLTRELEGAAVAS